MVFNRIAEPVKPSWFPQTKLVQACRQLGLKAPCCATGILGDSAASIGIVFEMVGRCPFGLSDFKLLFILVSKDM